MILDILDDIIEIRSHSTAQLGRHVSKRNVGYQSAHEAMCRRTYIPIGGLMKGL